MNRAALAPDVLEHRDRVMRVIERDGTRASDTIEAEVPREHQAAVAEALCPGAGEDYR